jgi:hypothetical protein
MNSVFARSTVKHMPIDTGLTYAHEIPGMCTKLAKIMNEMPLFNGKGSIVKKCKVISLAKASDARICGIFNTNSRCLLGDRNGWPTYDFDTTRIWRYADGQLIEQGLTLLVYDDAKICSYEALEASYNEVFSNLVNGWERSKIENHPNILFKEDPEKFALFIKNSTLSQEDILIRSIASRFSLEDDIKCQGEWLTNSGYSYCDKIYLWARKSALKNVRKTVGLKL